MRIADLILGSWIIALSFGVGILTYENRRLNSEVSNIRQDHVQLHCMFLREQWDTIERFNNIWISDVFGRVHIENLQRRLDEKSRIPDVGTDF